MCWPLSNWNRCGTTSPRVGSSRSFAAIRAPRSRDLNMRRHCGRSVISTHPLSRRHLAIDASHPPAKVSEKTADFAAELGAPAAARRFVRDGLRQWGDADEDLVDEVALVVSELATNAVVHAGTAFSVGIRVLPAQQLVRLSVRDADPIMSTIGDSSPAAQAGWGLSLVAELASCWGVETTSDGKVVWAEFDLVPS